MSSAVSGQLSIIPGESHSRRGEGGEEWQGGPLWSPARSLYRHNGLRDGSGDRYTLQDGGKGIAAKQLEQALFGFCSDLVQHNLDTCIHTAAASSVLLLVCHCD